MQIGTVDACWRFPVKSFQGLSVDRLDIVASGVTGDRGRALIDTESGNVLSAKRVGRLLQATADDTVITLPDGHEIALDSPALDEDLSAWLGRDVTLAFADDSDSLSFEMTFDPPDDTAEYYEIPVPDGTFLDLAPLHVVTTATLEGCAELRPDLDWDVRRFRPNLVLRVGGPTFVEDEWSGRRIRLGRTCVITVDQPTVRCAMPLRAQPALGSAGLLERQPELFAAMGELHGAKPNHLGAYASVHMPGPVAVGDPVELLDD